MLVLHVSIAVISNRIMRFGIGELRLGKYVITAAANKQVPIFPPIVVAFAATFAVVTFDFAIPLAFARRAERFLP